MQNFEAIGRWIVLAGVIMVLMGGVIWLLGKLKLFENLPGTLRVEAGGFRCIVPILASIIISIVLTVAANIVLRLLNR